MIDNFEEFLQRSIPSLFHHTRRNLHTENIDFLEYFESRLDDRAYLIRSFILQCEDHNTSEDFLQLLYLLHENISGVNGQFQDICFMHGDYASEMEFSCPFGTVTKVCQVKISDHLGSNSMTA